MIESIQCVRFGRPANVALRAVIDRVKDERGPLATVTVVVASNYVGLSTRRVMGSHGGLTNVSFMTPVQLVDTLAPPASADPLSTPVLRAAVRQTLRAHAGSFAAVVDHQATEAAFTDVYQQVSPIGQRERKAIASVSARDREVMSIVTDIARHVERLDDDTDRAMAVVRAAAPGEMVDKLGAVVWFLPGRLTAPLEPVMRVVLEHASSAVLIGITGAAGDAAVIETCRRVGVDTSQITLPERPVATQVVSVTDEDEEALEAVRQVVEWAKAGIPLDRIGVLYPSRSPYLRTLVQRFDRAAIPVNATSADTVGSGAAGRTLLSALGLPAAQWRRDQVMSLVASAPVRYREAAIRPGAWERLSREAGVVSGNWQGSLDRLRGRREQELEAIGESGAPERLRRDIEEVDRLRAFLEDLEAALQRISRASTWEGKSSAAMDLLHQLIGTDRHWQRWPEFEQRSAQAVEAALVRLSELDQYDPEPSDRVFQQALRGELDQPQERTRPFGHGVYIGPLGTAPGLDFDAVIVVGMAEGDCPRPAPQQSLLGEAARAASGGRLLTRSEEIAEQHRVLLAALDSAPEHARILTFPRGGIRDGRVRLPSRWLLDTVSDALGRRIYSTDFLDLEPGPHLRVVNTHAAGISAARPAGVTEWEVATALAGGGEINDPVFDLVRRGAECMAARGSAEFTEWDGNLAGAEVPSPAATGEIMSATRLESWAQCGMRYFLQTVLGLRDRDDPESIIDLSPLERGSALHEVLEVFIGEAIAHGSVPSPGSPWGTGQVARCFEIAADVFASLEARGRTGRSLVWRIRQRELVGLVANFLESDNLRRSASGATPIAVELSFGFGDSPSALVELGNGRSVRFRGSIDRVDQAPDGSLQIYDYKSGKGDRYQDIVDGDCVAAGTVLQLGVYSEAVKARPGAESVSAAYWLLEGQSSWCGYRWDDERRNRFVEVVNAILDGIEDGVFNPVPGDLDSWRGTYTHCQYCPFDSLCPRDRGTQAAMLTDHPRLAVRQRLALPEVNHEPDC